MSQPCTAGQAAASLAAGQGSETRTGDSPAATGAAGSPGMWPAGARLTSHRWAGPASNPYRRCPTGTRSYNRLVPGLQQPTTSLV